MITFLIIVGVVVAIITCLLLIYIGVFSSLGHAVADTHETRIKQTLGYDFGKNYVLLYSRMRDGMIWVLHFQDDDTWAQLLAHGHSMKEGESFVTMEDGVYRIRVSKEQIDYEFNGRDKDVDGMYMIDFTIIKELNDAITHPIITICIDYSKRILFYDYDSGI